MSESRSGVAPTESIPARWRAADGVAPAKPLAGVAPANGFGVGASRRAGVIPEKSDPARVGFSPPSRGV